VEELYRRCSAVDDRISISTVYRTVKLFEDAGIIERHEFRNGRARYEQMPDSHHDHLINLRTGEGIEFQSEDIERLQADVARRLGYRLGDHRLELYAIPRDDKPKRRWAAFPTRGEPYGGPGGTFLAYFSGLPRPLV